MRTTIGLPGTLFRQVKAARRRARHHAEAFLHRSAQGAKRSSGALDIKEDPIDEIAEPPWMAGFGGLSDLGDEHRRILKTIEARIRKAYPRGSRLILDTNALSAWAEGRREVEAPLRSARNPADPAKYCPRRVLLRNPPIAPSQTPRGMARRQSAAGRSRTRFDRGHRRQIRRCPARIEAGGQSNTAK